MILITGGTGNVGKELVKLLARPEEPIRVMVRGGAGAKSIAYPGVEIVEGDFAQPATLDAALRGIDRAFLLTPPVENQVDLESGFLAAARRSRLRRIVKQSALGADADSPARLLRGHAESERRIVESGILYTFLRSNQFMQNFVNYRETIIHRGEFYAPMGDGHISLVDSRDVAAVAAETLEEHGHDNKVYEVTGPESLTYAEAAGRLSAALGKPVTYVDVPPEKAREAMLQSGMSGWLTDALLELFALWKAGAAAEMALTVQEVAKKDPIAFADFAHDYAPQFGHSARDPLGRLMDEINLDNMTPGA